MTDARILQGDSIESLRTLHSESVQMVCTSPPYFGLRSYLPEGHKDKHLEHGLEPTPAEYVARLVAVFREVRRVLADDGTLFLNLGDSYFSGSQHASACGTSDKEPVDFQASDCLCGNLCDACRRAYRIGKSRNDVPLVPTQDPSPFAPNHAHTESSRGHLPTLNSARRVSHNERATHDLKRTALRASVPAPASQSSMSSEFSRLLQDEYWPKANHDECLLCARSLTDCVEESAYTSDEHARTRSRRAGTASPSGRQMRRSQGTCAYCSTLDPHVIRRDIQPQCSLKHKDLIGVPWRVAFALQADGWYLRQDIIWAKPNPMPESVRDRCTKAHEYVFLLSKSPRYFYDADAVKEPAVCVGDTRHLRTDRTQDLARPDNGSRSRTGKPQAETRNRRSVWTITPKPFRLAHFAVMPEALVEPCILAGSRPGDLVLDPFAGSGTVGVVARRHGRAFVGCELNPEYAAMARTRIAA